jgi:thiamine kinase-like enzyme
MNKIEKLLEEDYVLKLFKERILPQYKYFSGIKKIEINCPKKNIWRETYHVVFEYITYFFDQKGKEHIVPIYCSAHSDEPRKNVFVSLKYLWNNGFNSNRLSIPRPLFYSNRFKGTFYRGVEGKNLYYYIRHNNREEIEKIVPMAAEWFSKLHKLSIKTAINFNKNNSRIKTVVPGKNHLFESIERRYPEHFNFYLKVYDFFIKNEEDFLRSTQKRWLIHGDAHPENIIRVNEKKIGVIDFTDLSLSDFARDLGTFIQQVEFMIMRKISDRDYADKIKNIFLEEYLKNAKIELDEKLKERIDNYYFWTATRTASFFLLKDNEEPGRGKELIEQIKTNLKI